MLQGSFGAVKTIPATESRTSAASTQPAALVIERDGKQCTVTLRDLVRAKCRSHHMNFKGVCLLCVCRKLTVVDCVCASKCLSSLYRGRTKRSHPTCKPF